MGMGTAPECDLLVHALGVGDEPVGTASGDNFLAGADAGRSRWTVAMDLVWFALGHCSAEQHFPAFVLTGCGIVGLVPPGESWKAASGRRSDCVHGVRRLHHAMDNSQLSDVWKIHLCAR